MKKKYFFVRHRSVSGLNPGRVQACGSGYTKNVSARCDMANGLRVIVRLCDIDDIEGAVDDGTTPVIKESITLKSGKKWKKYEGLRTSQGAKFETVEKPYRTFYSHMVDLVVFKAGGLVITELEGVVSGSTVAVVEYVDRGVADDSAFEIFGLKQGMKGTVTRDSKDSDTGGAFKLSLKSDPDRLEPHMPSPLLDTDYDTTLAALVANDASTTV